MALNIQFDNIRLKKYLLLANLCILSICNASVPDDSVFVEPIHACVIARKAPLSRALRTQISTCLGWEANPAIPTCHGTYHVYPLNPVADNDAIYLRADDVSFYQEGVSTLSGHVQVRHGMQMVNAQTATIYRDPKTHNVTKVELYDDVQYLEPDKWMVAKKATLNPHDKSGKIEDVLYRFDSTRKNATLPAWGRASLVERFANQNHLLKHATYTTCKPRDGTWQLQAETITLNHAKQEGVAKNAIISVQDLPVFYTPYFSFPTSSARKSGFLMPYYGYSNVGGYDLATPYYWNIAPNYDATLIPHYYALRGVMLGGEGRFLTPNSSGVLGGHFLPNDRAFGQFLADNQSQYPILDRVSNDRWSFLVHESTSFSSNLHMNINYQQVSDDYYLQDFSNNLAVLTENQLLRQGDLVYTTDHWTFAGMLQSYQTLHPITQSAVADVYERLPQLQAKGFYDGLPLNANFNLLGQYDYFHWPSDTQVPPQGPRYHLDPMLSFPQTAAWGYITPAIQVMENYYDLHYGGFHDNQVYNRTIPRYSVDGGLFFERSLHFFDAPFTQTLEPRLYYLDVPYHNQSQIPAFESGYMIFTTNQLFRADRFSGFDRIGDTNQLSYGVTSRLLSDETGSEKLSATVGQIRYFSKRRVQLCYSPTGICEDSPLTLGYIPPNATYSPIASQAVYRMDPSWSINGDYVWDVYTHATNNGDINLHYQPASNRIINFGYSYLTDGNTMFVPNHTVDDNSMNQATIAYAWPVTENWSTLGAYGYNISKSYNMMAFFGVQYDNCCWAARLLGGRTFQNINPTTLMPEYNNSVYFQVLLKGLGAVANSDPSTTINTYLPGYPNIFRR